VEAPLSAAAYKFLGPGAIGRFSGFAWPLPHGDEPGLWVEATGELSLCRTGVHACGASQLPHWLDDELWEAELDGERLDLDVLLVARRGRLVRRVRAWDDEAARAFAADCKRRVLELVEEAGGGVLEGYDADAVRIEGRTRRARTATLVALAATHAAEAAAPGGGDVERARQARWLADALAL
jgi:hypothetical protein